MIYALLDSTTVIDMPHLDAAIAIWNYAEASARLIFSEVEATDPLESVLLEKITASPGINRKSLHKALGGHVKAEAMVKALGSLAGQGKVRSEMVPTGGRRSECWWPVLTPSALPLTVESADEPPPDANERTKSDESAQADQSQDSSFAREMPTLEVASMGSRRTEKPTSMRFRSRWQSFSPKSKSWMARSFVRPTGRSPSRESSENCSLRRYSVDLWIIGMSLL